MSEGTAIPFNKIEPLNDRNYHVWALKISAVLRARKLFEEVIINDEPPTVADQNSDAGKKRSVWEGKNDEAFGILITTLSDDQAGQFLTATKAKQIWQQLQNIHAGRAQDRRIDIAVELKNIIMNKNESVMEYITKAKNIASRSASIGFPIEDRELSYHVVRGIHIKYEKVASVLRAQRSATMDDIRQALEEEERRASQGASGVEDGPQNRWKDERAYKAFRGNRRQQVNNGGCFICGRKNHRAVDCFHKKEKEYTNPSYRGRQNTNRYTHENNRNASYRGRRECARLATDANEEYSFNVEKIRTKSRHPDESGIWTLDSGSSTHMSPDIQRMTEVKPYKVKVNLAEDERAMMSRAKGDIRLATDTQEGKRNVLIKNVLYIPKLRGNLLSVSKLCENGHKVIFENHRAKIIGRNDEVIAEAYERNGIYTIRSGEPNDTIPVAFNANQKTEEKQQIKRCNKKDKMLWHRRLGHTCEYYMDKMRNTGAIRDLYYRQQDLGICEACVMGKLSQTPHKRIEGIQAKEPLELIHMDVCGPMPVQSRNGNKYILVIVDEYSRYAMVYLMRTKDETYGHFMQYMNESENALHRKIRNVRTDNGGEFVNKKFEELYKSRGIKHQRTVAYNPQSNGTAERLNRTLLEKTRTLLIDADLPGEFWGEAVMTAVYIKNLTIAKTIGMQTPQERWNGKKPTVSYLKTFGCLTYYFIPKIGRDKLMPKAERGIFVGYSHERRAYRVYDPIKDKVYATRTARFKEDEKGSQLLNVKSGLRRRIEDIRYESQERRQEWNGEEQLKTIEHNNNENNEERVQTEEIEETETYPNTTRKEGRRPGVTMKEIHEQRHKERERNEEMLIEAGVRRSERIKNKREQVNYMASSEPIPQKYREAMESNDYRQWKRAMEEEVEIMKQRGVWDLVNREEGMKVLKSKWVYTIKQLVDGKSLRFKARLVAVGCNQWKGTHYEESFAPVLKLGTARIMLALASIHNMEIRQYDVRAAYLYGAIKETIFMEQPDGFKKDESKVCRLKRSIYGLPQAGNCWNAKITEVLESLGMKRSPEDPCLYTIKRSNKKLWLGLYVDDILVVGTDSRIITEVIDEIKGYFELTETRELKFLNIRISRQNGNLALSQTDYIDNLLQKYNLQESRPVGTPMDPYQDLDVDDGSPPEDSKYYQEMLGSIMYLATGTRVDIAFSVSRLSQYSKNPKQIHLMALKRVFRYLKGTKHYKLEYNGSADNVNFGTDASWNSTKDAKSFGGYLVKIGNNVVDWRSKKQELVALSTCEAELIAISDGVQEVKWVYGILESLEINNGERQPIQLSTDSKAAIDWINKSHVTNRTKHINRKYHFVKDEVKSGSILLHHVRSEELEADILTKPLASGRIKNHLDKISLRSNV